MFYKNTERILQRAYNDPQSTGLGTFNVVKQKYNITKNKKNKNGYKRKAFPKKQGAQYVKPRPTFKGSLDAGGKQNVDIPKYLKEKKKPDSLCNKHI